MMKNLLSNLLNTENDVAMLVARLVVGGVMFPHGAQKVFGWFGGFGFHGTMGFFTGVMGIPWIFALAAILAESLGSVALLFGFSTRLAAAAIAVNMVVAILTSHLQAGFFMNWFGNQKGEGFEYHLLVLGLAAVLMIKGGGVASIDLALASSRTALQTETARSV
jgi:putative oxidoreductase